MAFEVLVHWESSECSSDASHLVFIRSEPYVQQNLSLQKIVEMNYKNSLKFSVAIEADKDTEGRVKKISHW